MVEIEIGKKKKKDRKLCDSWGRESREKAEETFLEQGLLDPTLSPQVGFICLVYMVLI